MTDSLLDCLSQSLPANLHCLRLDFRDNNQISKPHLLFEPISLLYHLAELEILIDSLSSIPLEITQLRFLKRLAISAVKVRSMPGPSFFDVSHNLLELEMKLSLIPLGNSFITSLADLLHRQPNLSILKLFLSSTGLVFTEYPINKTELSPPPNIL